MSNEDTTALTLPKKFPDEAYQLLILYEAQRGQGVDNNVLARVLDCKYKGAWDQINRAKKPLVAAGLTIPNNAGGGSGTSSSPKKRKVDDADVNGDGEATTKAGKGAKGKKGSAKADKVAVKEEKSDDE